MIELTPLVLTYRIEGLYKLAPFPGSMWRGGFGLELKRLSCAHNPICGKACVQPHTCAYGAIFETPLSETHPRLGNVQQAPRPFALYPTTQGPAILEAGSEIKVCWTLWSEAMDFLPYCLIAWRSQGRNGLFPGRVPATLLTVHHAVSGELLFAKDSTRFRSAEPVRFSLTENGFRSRVRLDTLSPLRIKHKDRLVGKTWQAPQLLPSWTLFFTLLRRVETCFYREEVRRALQPLYQNLDEPHESQSEFSWHEVTRYSHRQQEHLQMGGLLGSMQWETLSAPWVNLLRIGEYLQIGKGTTMGLGKYRLTVEEAE